MHTVYVRQIGLFQIIGSQIFGNAFMVRTKETIVIHVRRFIIARFTFTVYGKPVRMCFQYLVAVHRPLPVVCFQTGFLTHLVRIFIVAFEHYSADTTFFQQCEIFFVIFISFFFVDAHPYPVLYLAGSNGFATEPSGIVNHVTYFLFGNTNRHAERMAGSLYRDFRPCRKIFQLSICKEEVLFCTQIVFLFRIVIQLCIIHRPKQFIRSHVIRILKGFCSLSYHFV